MHPGPMNRGVEISDEVADGPYSVILDQVENGVAVRMAILFCFPEVRVDHPYTEGPAHRSVKRP